MLKYLCPLVLILFSPFYPISAEKNSFDDLSSLQKKVTLKDPQLKFISLYTAKISPSGNVWIIDCLPTTLNYRGLKKFSADGRLEQTIIPPPPDSVPTEKEEKFFGFVEDNNERVFANSARVIFVYDSGGRLRTTYPIGTAKPKRREEVWGSNIRKIDVAPNNKLVGVGVGFPTPNYLHIYDTKGKLLNEFFPLDSKFAEGEALVNPGLSLDSLGDIWCTHSAFYKVFHYGVDGTQKKGITGKSSVFTPPDLSKRPTSSLKKRYQWFKTWTPIMECAATQSGYIILSMLAGEKGKPFMKNYDPEPLALYGGGIFLDVYDREGNLIVSGLHTPHRFLCVDSEDNLWFVLAPQTPENPAKDGPVVLGKYKLNLKPAMAKEGSGKAGK